VTAATLPADTPAGSLSLIDRLTRSRYFWLCLATSAVTFTGFWFSYFGPMLAGNYQQVSATVHLHGWTFFLWYLLLPLQAGLVAGRQVKLHRTLGYTSIGLALLMTFTGLVVIGTQMKLAQAPDGNPFWKVMGPGVFSTLVLFAVCYALAIRYRRQKEHHRRLMLLASTGGLGAAGFRLLGQIIGFGPAAGIGGIILPNLIIVAAMLIEWRRGEGVHPVYRWGLPISVVTELLMIFGTTTPAGQAVSSALAWLGTVLAPLY
jgi:hypothetical protein